jgi:hypothetical protein
MLMNQEICWRKRNRILTQILSRIWTRQNLPSADEIFFENLSGLTPKSHKMACFGTDAYGLCLTNFVSSDPSGRICSPTANSGLTLMFI